MPEPSPKLGLSLPLGNETVNRAAYRANLLEIDEKVAPQSQVDELSPLVPLIAQTITYDTYGRPITVASDSVTYQITYNADGTLNTISNGIKTMQAQYNEWGQFIGTVML